MSTQETGTGDAGRVVGYWETPTNVSTPHTGVQPNTSTPDLTPNELLRVTAFGLHQADTMRSDIEIREWIDDLGTYDPGSPEQAVGIAASIGAAQWILGELS